MSLTFFSASEKHVDAFFPFVYQTKRL